MMTLTHTAAPVQNGTEEMLTGFEPSDADAAWFTQQAALKAEEEALRERLDEIAAFAAALETYLLEHGGAEEQELAELGMTPGRSQDTGWRN